MKNRIRLNVSQLNRVINESINKVLSEAYPTPTKSDYQFQHPTDEDYEHSETYKIRGGLRLIEALLSQGFPSTEIGKPSAGERIRTKMLEYIDRLNKLNDMLEKQTIPYYTGEQMETGNSRYNKK